jgi:hypothetical protein
MAIKKVPTRLANAAVKKKIDEGLAKEGIGKYAPKPAPKGSSAESGMGKKVAKGKKYSGIKRGK